MRTFALAAAGLLSVATANVDRLKQSLKSNFEHDRLVEIAHEHLSEEAVSVLQAHVADHFGSHETGSHFKLSPEAIRALEAQNIDFKDQTEAWISEFESQLDDENFICRGEKCAERDMQNFYSSYQDLASLHARAQSVVSGVSFAQIGSIGLSYQGRNQLTVEIGDGTKPLVFYFCNIHAREWLTPMYCMYMAETLIADGGHSLLDTFDFTILISANPDGYVYTHTNDNLWRKTRRPNPGSSCVGTDPNRNYDNRHCGAGTSNNPCDQTFCGPAPWSEIEVANIRDFGLANAARLIAMNDIHSYSQLWMYPYGGVSATSADFTKQNTCSAAAVNAIAATSGTTWDYGPIYSTIYPAAGTSVDWFYDTPGVVYAMTAELRGTNFQPSASNIIPSNNEVFAAMVASLACVKDQENLPGGPVATPPPVPTSPPTPTCTFFC